MHLMPDAIPLTFAHHLIPLPLLPGAAGAVGAKACLESVKNVCRFIGQIHRVLHLDCRVEIAVVPPESDFFDIANGSAKTRNMVWRAVEESTSIQWIIFTRHPHHVPKLLPADWIGKGYRNVCLSLMVETTDNLDTEIVGLRSIQARFKMLCIQPSANFTSWDGDLKGIDWIVFSGTGDDITQANFIRNKCCEAGVAFLFHRTDGKKFAAPDESSPPVHPFGPKVRLDRPPLPDIIAKVAQIHSLVAAPDLSASATHPETSTESQDQKCDAPPALESPSQVLHLDFEVMDEVAAAVGGVKSVSPPAEESDPTAADQEEFNHLDGIVRTSLGYFITAGHALRAIRDRELWRAGGHPSWAEYSRTVGGLTKVHANRLIRAAQIAQHLAGVEPIGFTPVAESQMRQLCRLQKPEQYTRAWSLGVERAGGGQPTAKQLSNVVAELMADEQRPAKATPSRKQLVSTMIQQLRKAVRAKKPTTEIENMIVELEKILRLV
ncbi:MAG: DUF5131 family protein [Luteolibacter sp.]